MIVINEIQAKLFGSCNVCILFRHLWGMSYVTVLIAFNEFVFALKKMKSNYSKWNEMLINYKYMTPEIVKVIQVKNFDGSKGQQYNISSSLTSIFIYI